MNVIIHFLNGNDLAIQDHYREKEYRTDVIVQIGSLYYEVYFFVFDSLQYELTKDGFFSFPGLIVLDEITNSKIYAAIDQLIDHKYFEAFIGKKDFPLNNRFLNSWYLNHQSAFSLEKTFQYRL